MKKLCEFGSCTKKAKVSCVQTNMETSEVRRFLVCHSHLPSVLHNCHNEGRQIEFTVISKGDTK